MTEYVLIYTTLNFNDPYVLLVLKDKPAWQLGKYNLPGGRVEQGETPDQAAIRELKEETGYTAVSGTDMLGKIVGEDVIIYCYNIYVNDARHHLNPRPEETQKVNWHWWADVKNSQNLMPNLKVIVPLLKERVKGWTLTDENDGVKLRFE